MSVHINFADWYRSAAITTPEGILQKRWAAVEAIAKKPTAKLIVELARLFIFPKATETDVPEDFRVPFREHDDNFASRDNLLELRVLAGAVLRQVIEEKSQLATIASLAFVCGSFGPRLATLLQRDHVDCAEQFLLDYAKEIRSCATPSSPKNANVTKSRLSELLPEAQFAQALPNLREPLLKALAEIGSSQSAAQKTIDALSHRVGVREEELNILWWLQNRFSKHLQKPFSDVGYEAGSLIFPIEMAEITSFVPGPESAIAILLHALHLAGASNGAASIPIAKAVNATPREWREKIRVEHDLSHVRSLCPLLLAIQKSLDTDGAEEWFPVYRKVCDIPVDHPFPLLDIAVQIYRERLFVRLSAEEGM